MNKSINKEQKQNLKKYKQFSLKYKKLLMFYYKKSKLFSIKVEHYNNKKVFKEMHKLEKIKIKLNYLHRLFKSYHHLAIGEK